MAEQTPSTKAPDDSYELFLSAQAARRMLFKIQKWADTLDGDVPAEGREVALIWFDKAAEELMAARAVLMRAIEDSRGG